MTGSISTTRGVPFDPGAAQAQRQQAMLIARELDRQAQEEAKRQRQEARRQHKEAMRAYGRRLDEEAVQRKRKQRKQQIEQCYREREKS